MAAIPATTRPAQPIVVALLADNEPTPSSATEAPIDPMISQLEAELRRARKEAGDVERRYRKPTARVRKTRHRYRGPEKSGIDTRRFAAIIKRVGSQLYLWNIELEAEQRIKVVEPASRPQGDDAVAKYAEVGFAGIFGFCAALLLVRQSSGRRWRSAIASGVLLGGLSAAAAWALVPVHYEAQSLIKVQRVIPMVIGGVSKGRADEGAAYDIFKKTQLQLLKSNLVLARAARRSEMVALKTMQEHKEDPVGYLESNLIVDYPGDAELMRVAIKGTHRDELATIVNSIVQSYLDEVVNGDQVAKLKQRDRLNQHYSKNQEEFRNKSEKYHALARQLGASTSEAARLRRKIAEQRLESLVASANALSQRVRDKEIDILLLRSCKARAGDGASATPSPATGNSP